MTIYTGCPHCDKSIFFNHAHKEVGVEPGKLRVAAKVRCEKCDGMSDVLITVMPTGETP